ncbi:hypothetical protein ACFZDG_35520 [Kitasatospora xanthocidica]|uniref:hypothetical protein n=1 Tax=Kitasatospora xanthocidica TaxID=83382 RepID=UPI0036EBC5C9
MLLLIALAVGCSSGQTKPKPAPPTATDLVAAPIPAGREGSPKAALPDLGKVNGADPSAVAGAALATIWTIDTTLDASRYDAEKRAVQLYTPQRAAGLHEVSPRAVPGADWAVWAAHQAYTTVAVQQSHEDGGPEDGPTLLHQRWVVTVTPHGRDGWTGQAGLTIAFVTLTRADTTQPWRLDTLTIG